MGNQKKKKKKKKKKEKEEEEEEEITLIAQLNVTLWKSLYCIKSYFVQRIYLKLCTVKIIQTDEQTYGTFRAEVEFLEVKGEGGLSNK